MKTRRRLLALGCVLAISMVRASESPAPADKDAMVASNYVLVPGCCIRKMAPVTATISHRNVDRAFLKTADGNTISIGGFGSTPEIVRFIASLQVDATYRFPEVFLDHEKAMRGETLEVSAPAQKVAALRSITNGVASHER
jgi:hypothetical protein